MYVPFRYFPAVSNIDKSCETCFRQNLSSFYGAAARICTTNKDTLIPKAEVARKHGLFGFTNDQIESNFRAGKAQKCIGLESRVRSRHANPLEDQAFKSEADRYPNYGKTVGMNPAQWWSNIIHATFRPFSSKDNLPERLILDLLTRFSSAAGYKLYPDVLPFFKAMRQLRAPAHGDSISSKPIVGIITNSDDRVPAILLSLGLHVGLWRHKHFAQASFRAEDDINFVMTSYDVGFEKPDSKIFDSTKQMLSGQERFVHIGDDLQKDYYASKRAGWEGFLLNREAKTSWPQDVGPIPRITDLRELVAHIG